MLHSGVPTLRPRHMITESDDLATALDRAALVWPELHGDRAALLRNIVARGVESVNASDDQRRAGRRSAIRETAGSLPGVYPPGEAQRLRAEWPE